MLGFHEYVTLSRASGLDVPAVAAGAAAMLTCAAFAPTSAGAPAGVPLDVVLMSALVALGAWRSSAGRVVTTRLRPRRRACFRASTSGLPLGAMAAVRETRGPDALFLLMLTVIVSDTAQYYSGRAFGRRLLAPADQPEEDRRRGDGRIRFRRGHAGARWARGGCRPCRSPVASCFGVDRRGARDCRRSVRVDAEAQRRREGQLVAHPRARRRARSHRCAALRRARVLRGLEICVEHGQP